MAFFLLPFLPLFFAIADLYFYKPWAKRHQLPGGLYLGLRFIYFIVGGLCLFPNLISPSPIPLQYWTYIFFGMTPLILVTPLMTLKKHNFLSAFGLIATDLAIPLLVVMKWLTDSEKHLHPIHLAFQCLFIFSSHLVVLKVIPLLNKERTTPPMHFKK